MSTPSVLIVGPSDHRHALRIDKWLDWLILLALGGARPAGLQPFGFECSESRFVILAVDISICKERCARDIAQPVLLVPPGEYIAGVK